MASKLLYAVDISLKELGAERDSKKDKAARELARHYANFIDETVAYGDPIATQKALQTVGANLQKSLHSLGLTPESRGELSVSDVKPKGSAIDELKAKRASKRTAG